MNPVDLRTRTRDFALRIIRLFESLPRTTTAQTIGRQILRSGTSVGAHYREACRARSTAEFISKIEGGLQELDETQYWLELIVHGGIFSADRMSALEDEANQLMAILVACVKNAKEKK
ncbi:MAG TPA: four helix bundle protein [Fimbriiglobus sp.]